MADGPPERAVRLIQNPARRIGRHAPTVFDLSGEERTGCSVRFAVLELCCGSVSGSGASVPSLLNYLAQAILLTLVSLVLSPFTLFFPFLEVITGIVAIVYGARINGQVAGGKYVGASDSSRLAGVWTWIVFAFVIIEVLNLAAFLLTFGATGASA